MSITQLPRPTIVPCDEPGDYRQHTILGITVAQVEQAIGFPPNVEDDPCLVSNSWGFTVDGIRCGVWSMKGSERLGRFSAYGPVEILRRVFPDAKVEG